MTRPRKPIRQRGQGRRFSSWTLTVSCTRPPRTSAMTAMLGVSDPDVLARLREWLL